MYIYILYCVLSGLLSVYEGWLHVCRLGVSWKLPTPAAVTYYFD